jgi:hypothetical protein
MPYMTKRIRTTIFTLGVTLQLLFFFPAVVLSCPPCYWCASMCCDSHDEAKAECAALQERVAASGGTCHIDCQDSGSGDVAAGLVCIPPPINYPAMDSWRYPTGQDTCDINENPCCGNKNPCCGKECCDKGGNGSNNGTSQGGGT